MSRVGNAATAVARGAHDEALVVLWNEVEPARLAGDRRSLAAIEGLAGRIAERGDEGQRREAERLREAVAALRAEDASVPAPRVGAAMDGLVEPAAGDEGDQPAAEEGSAAGFELGRYVWVLILLAVLALNLIRQLAD